MAYKLATGLIMCVLWAIGRRFKKQRVYFLLILILSIQAIFVLQSRHVRTVPEKDDPTGGIQIVMNYFHLIGHCISATLLLAPSLAFTLFYTAVSMVALVLSAALTQDLTSPLWQYILAITVFPICVFGPTLFYILQIRELKRFFEQQKATRQQKEAELKE